jgi:hypothetical protein
MRHLPRIVPVPDRSSHPIRTVVITHQGMKPYLDSCVRRAMVAAAGGRVILLGDVANAGVGACEHHRIDDPSLQADLDEFRGMYRQIGQSQEFLRERFWIERWFLIRNFLRREKLDGCLAIDSDVLLFGDVGTESLRFAPYAMTFGRWDAVRVVPHCNFIRGLSGLEDFCAYVLDVYREPRRLARLKDINRKKFGAAWISDMSLLASWGATSGFPVGFLEDTLADGVGFDSCLDATHGYVACGYLPGILRQWKRIVFRDGCPYATIRGGGLDVPMKCLHYHGKMKALINRHARCQDDDWGAAGLMLMGKAAEYPKKCRLLFRNYIRPWLPGAAISPGSK